MTIYQVHEWDSYQSNHGGYELVASYDNREAAEKHVAAFIAREEASYALLGQSVPQYLTWHRPTIAAVHIEATFYSAPAPSEA